jgi:phospholipid/cholesterol/gamma-HCH transport system substrate-binding protein
MNERVVALRVGIVVLAAAFVTGFLIILLGEGRALWQGRYTIYLRFAQAPGVSIDTPVRKHGVLIGRVTDIELLDEGGVFITARIDSNRKIFKDEVCRISSTSILGDAVLEFVPAGERVAQKIPVQDGEVIADTVVASDPMRMLTSLEGDVRRAVQSFDRAANNISELTIRLNNSLGAEDQLPRLMQKAELTLDRFRVAMDSVDQLVGDPELRDKLRQGLSDLPVTLDEMRLTMSRARDSLDSFQAVQQKAERNLDNMERFTKPLGERGDELVRKVDSIFGNINVITTEIAELSHSVRNSEGSLARLIRDDELYVKIDDTVDGLRDAVRRLRPILNDFRVLSDKLATDPRLLGVKGALDHKPAGVGIKGMVPPLREFPATWQQRLGEE